MLIGMLVAMKIQEVVLLFGCEGRIVVVRLEGCQIDLEECSLTVIRRVGEILMLSVLRCL